MSSVARKWALAGVALLLCAGAATIAVTASGGTGRVRVVTAGAIGSETSETTLNPLSPEKQQFLDQRQAQRDEWLQTHKPGSKEPSPETGRGNPMPNEAEATDSATLESSVAAALPADAHATSGWHGVLGNGYAEFGTYAWGVVAGNLDDGRGWIMIERDSQSPDNRLPDGLAARSEYVTKDAGHLDVVDGNIDGTLTVRSDEGDQMTLDVSKSSDPGGFLEPR